MKKSTIAGILLGAAAVPTFLLAPGFAAKSKKAPFLGRNFAHRGLYEKDQSVPENSLPAFRRACDAGYGIELDIQLSKDGRVVVFHDDYLNRACGFDGEPVRVDSLTWDELKELRLFGTDERIPLFTEVLDLVAGRVPLIVELKTGPRNELLCKSGYAILADYAGDYCIESFDPRIVAWFRLHAPGVLRGQLAEQPIRYELDENMSPLAGAVLGNTLGNFAARPHFIAYRLGKHPLPVRYAEALGAMKVAWTSHDAENEYGNDIVIFEHYTPEVRFLRSKK